MKALEIRAGLAGLLSFEQGPATATVLKPAAAPPGAGVRTMALLLVAGTLALGCTSGAPAQAPAPHVGSSEATERLPIDGLWAIAGEDSALVQLERGRLYLQSGFSSASQHGELLYGDIHQASPRSYRCQQPLALRAEIVWRACTLTLRNDGTLLARTPGAKAASEQQRSFERVALADETWFDAQAAAWSIVSAREAHRPARVAPSPSSSLPQLPPSPSPRQPAYSVPSMTSRFGRYHALVIGIGDYAYLPAVATAEADADAVSKLLSERYGFDVTDLRNPNLQALLAALQRYERELGDNDNLLIYYAGHGFLSAELGRCYWFPAEAMGDDPSQGIASNDVVGAVGNMKAKHVLIVADSCFTAVQRREAGLDESEGDVHQRLSKLPARVVLTSGELEPIQDGAGGRHSVFTGALLGALGANRQILDGTGLFEEIRELVSSASESPEYADLRGADQDGGDFLFVPLP